jgi:hypothetical protein
MHKFMEFVCILAMAAFAGAIGGVLGSLVILVVEDAWERVKDFWEGADARDRF